MSRRDRPRNPIALVGNPLCRPTFSMLWSRYCFPLAMNDLWHDVWPRSIIEHPNIGGVNFRRPHHGLHPFRQNRHDGLETLPWLHDLWFDEMAGLGAGGRGLTTLHQR